MAVPLLKIPVRIARPKRLISQVNAPVMDDIPEEFIPTRKSLLSRIKNWEDNASWRDFFETYWKLIYSVALKAGLTDAEAQDVVQETVLSVAKSIGQFKYDPAVCSFKTWLMQVSRRRIANQFERRRRHPLPPDIRREESSETPLLERLPDTAGGGLEGIWEAEWQKNLMDAAIRRVKRRVAIEQYQMFDFYVLKGWPVRKVAKTLGVTVGHVYVAKHRISRLIKKEVEQLEKKAM
jgi:RNA polymerase sigma factor (sigma-70 family)